MAHFDLIKQSERGFIFLILGILNELAGGMCVAKLSKTSVNFVHQFWPVISYMIVQLTEVSLT